MKLMVGQLEATSGQVYRHHHLRIARFHQHLTEQLDLSKSAVEWMCGEFGSVKPQEMRAIVGHFGLTGKSQVIPMEQLSDGQRRRVVFAWLAQKNCHLLMLGKFLLRQLSCLNALINP
jgi:ATP-binding cassette subfamily F protein 2